MSTVIQIEPELSSQAEVVLKQLGMTLSGAMDAFLQYVISRKKLPEDLRRPPIPCIDDMTEEELDELFAQGIAEIEAGHYYTAEEAEQMLGGSM
ncbi:MAG: type II toxin-antitoxin system RelB/DinJ family antitoxin [Synergistaceae bacterium]|nr:type II toxin-antitoxin system RelB/DinJ family antitoxin [Synergistaceae bacterium]